LNRGSRISVIDHDHALAALVDDGAAASARQASVAAVLQLPAGDWRGAEHADRARGGYGLLALGGLLVRRVGVEGRYSAELLGPGDLLRPWQHDGEGSSTMPFETTWRITVPARLAVLDLPWAARMARFPQIGAELAGRALMRSLRVVTMMAIAQQPRLDVRLWLLFWELADRFGTVHRDGVHLDLPLTHEVLSHMAAARRPSVSGALTKLADRGLVRREGRDWVLTGEPPGDVENGSAAELLAD
jgi:CRP/FNR family transcriptional regulator, cyclic AMP receptor protein